MLTSDLAPLVTASGRNPQSDGSLVTVTAQPKPFALLQPGDFPSRGIGIIVDPSCWDDAVAAVLRTKEVVAFDLETTGLDAQLPESAIVGMGLAGKEFNYYFHRLGNEVQFDKLFLRLLDSNLEFIAHNAYFDGQWVLQKYGKHMNWVACTSAWYRHLATEGWVGQRWGLKDAMVDVLGWPTPNDGALIEWLENAGFVNGAGKADKGQMWRCPPDVLGEYCLLDAEATYLLYYNVLLPALNRFPALTEYLSGPFLNLIKVLMEQKLHGILIDRDGLLAAQHEIRSSQTPAEEYLLRESELAPLVRELEAAKLAEFQATEPAQFLTKKLGKEPPQFRKDGAQSKVWEKWVLKRDTPPAVSKNWLRWSERKQLIADGLEPAYRFNLRSGDHLRWAFFDKMGYDAIEFSDSGLPSVAEDSLQAFGPVGTKLAEYLTLEKELSFVDTYLELTQDRQTVHPSFVTPGTYTGRLSGREPNIQQVPKSRRFLQCLKARPGHVWIDADFTSLEPVVCTELSGDPELMKVFGPTAPKGSDIYLHTGLGLPQFRDEIIAAGYDPDNFSAEGAAAAKKTCKKLRSICKVFYLSRSYGAGARKIHKTLQMQGIEIGLDAVSEMHTQYGEYYAGIKRWEYRLKSELRANHGWVLNGIGRPLGVHRDYERDVVNRVVQSTGHDILVKYIQILGDLLTESEISWKPIIVDFHDEVLVEVPEEQAIATVGAFKRAEFRLNEQLGGTIPLKINPVIVNNLAEAKIED